MRHTISSRILQCHETNFEGDFLDAHRIAVDLTMHRTLAHFLRIHSGHLWVKYWVSRNNRKVNDLTEVGVSTLEERMAKLERDVESLKRDCSKTGDLVAQKPGWISKVTGTFENAPEFDEILRLGREERKADVLNEE